MSDSLMSLHAKDHAIEEIDFSVWEYTQCGSSSSINILLSFAMAFRGGGQKIFIDSTIRSRALQPLLLSSASPSFIVLTGWQDHQTISSTGRTCCHSIFKISFNVLYIFNFYLLF